MIGIKLDTLDSNILSSNPKPDITSLNPKPFACREGKRASVLMAALTNDAGFQTLGSACAWLEYAAVFHLVFLGLTTLSSKSEYSTQMFP